MIFGFGRMTRGRYFVQENRESCVGAKNGAGWRGFFFGRHTFIDFDLAIKACERGGMKFSAAPLFVRGIGWSTHRFKFLDLEYKINFFSL
jgi:hypothetical protein